MYSAPMCNFIDKKNCYTKIQGKVRCQFVVWQLFSEVHIAKLPMILKPYFPTFIIKIW